MIVLKRQAKKFAVLKYLAPLAGLCYSTLISFAGAPTHDTTITTFDSTSGIKRIVAIKWTGRKNQTPRSIERRVTILHNKLLVYRSDKSIQRRGIQYRVTHWDIYENDRDSVRTHHSLALILATDTIILKTFLYGDKTVLTEKRIYLRDFKREKWMDAAEGERWDELPLPITLPLY